MSCAPLDVEQEIGALHARMQPRLRRVMARYHVPETEREDLVQEAFLALLRNWTRIDRPDAWLVGSVVRMSCAAIKRKLRGRLQYADASCLEALARPEQPAQKRADLLLDLETLSRRLPHRQRMLLRLHYALGLSTAEVAARLGYRESSIRKLSLRTLARLRAALQAPRGTSPGTDRRLARFQQTDQLFRIHRVDLN